WTATLTPNASATAATNILTLDNTGVSDLAGNAGSGSATSGNYAVDTVAPAMTFSALAFSADTGTSSTDFITKTAAQTITAALSAAPAGTDIVYGSLDNGTTWTDITGKVSGTTLTWNGVTLTGSDTLQLKVTDSASNDGAVTSQTYVLDTAIPSVTGAVANQAVTDKATIMPFSGLTLADSTVTASALTQTVTITLDDPAKGTLSAGGDTPDTGVYTFTGTVAEVNTAILGLIFTPTANRVAPGSTETTTFTVVSTDVAGNQVTNNTTTVVTTSVNDAPTLTNLSGDSINFSIGGSGVALDNSGNATVADLDSVNFNGGSVTVSITANGQAGEDVLQIGSVGNITASGGIVSDNDTQIGTYTGGTAGVDLVISLNAGATPALVQDLIRAIEYNNTSATTVNTAARTVTLTINDGGGTANDGADASSTQTMTVNLVRAPIIDLNGETTGNDYSGAFTEGGGAVAISDGAAGMSDDGTISTMTVTITNLQNGASESLSSTLGTEFSIGEGEQTTVTVAYDTGTGVLTITGTAISTADMSTILQSIRYNNTATAPGTEARVISIAATDNDAHVGNASTSTISVTAVNDAPAITNNATYTVTGIDENTASAGVTVNTVLTGDASWADPDGEGVDKGIAVTGTVGNGNWQYSTDGDTWVDFGTVSATSALLLDGATQVRYQPDTLNGETATFSYRAWDETTDTASTNDTRQTVDPGVGGTTTAYSVDSAEGSVAVSSVNDAPTGVGDLTLAAVNEDTVNPSGTAISALTGYSVQDIDTGATSPGILVVGNTANAATEGVWQYSSDGGANWKAIGAVANDATALALASATQVRFVPAANYNGVPPALSIRVLDNSYEAEFSTTTEGTENRVTVDSSVNGGATAISTNVNTISTSITAVNDAPVFIKGADQIVNEDAGAQRVTNWATGLSAGATNESGQTVHFIVTNNNNVLFSVQPTVDSNGNLLYTPAANANGIATITVSIKDSGGTANGGVDSNATKTFTITVKPVNDLPTGTVTISGTPSVGATLTAANTLADIDGLGVISYQWQADGIGITGATGSSYTLTNAEAGKTITLVARYLDAQGTIESVTSVATAQVEALAPINLTQQAGNSDSKPSSDTGTGNNTNTNTSNNTGTGNNSGTGNGIGADRNNNASDTHGSENSGTNTNSFGDNSSANNNNSNSGSSPNQTIVVDMKLTVDSHGNGTSGGTINLPSSVFAGLNMSGTITITSTQSSGQSLPSFISVNPSTGAVTVKEGAVVTSPITVKVTIRDSQGKQVVVLVKVQPQKGRAQQQNQGQEGDQRPDNENNQQPDGDNQQGAGRNQRSQVQQTDKQLAHAGKPGLTQQLQRVGSKGFELQRQTLLDSLASLVGEDKDAA
ncbi:MULTISPECIES: beta strand repeat-containing protein, partial [Methylobacter]